VTFHFENSLSLRVYPHEYLFLFVSISSKLTKVLFRYVCFKILLAFFLVFSLYVALDSYVVLRKIMGLK
jgi:hypothetical protein